MASEVEIRLRTSARKGWVEAKVLVGRTRVGFDCSSWLVMVCLRSGGGGCWRSAVSRGERACLKRGRRADSKSLFSLTLLQVS
jgi:hypothetical protein